MRSSTSRRDTPNPILTRVRQWVQDRLWAYDATAIYLFMSGGRHVFALVGEGRYWFWAVELEASSEAQACEAMSVLVREMRQTGIDRWLANHRAFARHGCVRLYASQILLVLHGPSIEEERASNYGHW